MKLIKYAAMAAVMMGACGAAQAEVFKDRLSVKVGVMGVLPDESASIRPIGGTAEISDEYLPAINLDYKINDRFSVEAICCIAPHEVKAVGTAVGTVDLGEVTLFPPTVTLKYHFFNDAPVKPYVGAGVNVTAFFNEKLPTGPVTSIDYETSVGGALQIGADIPIGERTFLNIDVKKVWIEPEVKLQTVLGPVTADAKINPIVAFVGFGWKF
jgi:outer membrane protein